MRESSRKQPRRPLRRNCRGGLTATALSRGRPGNPGVRGLHTPPAGSRLLNQLRTNDRITRMILSALSQHMQQWWRPAKVMDMIQNVLQASCKPNGATGTTRRDNPEVHLDFVTYVPTYLPTYLPTHIHTYIHIFT